MKKNNFWFTLVELVVVITILIILSAISFISYQKTITDARNATRNTDMSNIKMSLKNHKLKNGWYPNPWSSFDITNSWVIIKQWLLNDWVYTMELDKKPTDPLFKTQNYLYSITSNKQFFQVAMSLEDEAVLNDYWLIAYVDWDYQTLNSGFIPSIVFATNLSWSLLSLSSSFIVDKWTLNLPYQEDWSFIKTATNLGETINETWVSIPKYYWYSSCQEIYENWASMWSWSYILNWNTNSPTGC